MATDLSDDDLVAIIEQLSQLFDTTCQTFHEEMKASDGPLSFLENEPLEMLLASLCQTANEARYAFIQIGINAAFLEQGEENSKFHKTSTHWNPKEK